jgi:hypothetical protein
MPIRRNDDKHITNHSFNAKWKWDFRGKKENGPIVSCPSDPSLVGLVPTENIKYDQMMEELQEDCIPLSEVPDDAISMPEPASSRDSYKSGNDDFWRYVSDKLQEAWADIARERFKGLDSWETFLNMSHEEKKSLLRAYSEFGPSYKVSDPQTIVETIEDNVGVTVDGSACVRIHESQSKVNVVHRGSKTAETKSATKRKRIWEIIEEAPDGVYMGVSISQKKADIAWGLGDTHVVRLEGTGQYSELADTWDWNKLKNLPHRDLEEKLPELDDDVIEMYDTKSTSGGSSNSSSSSSSSSDTGGDGKNPEKYRMKVRVGAYARKYYSVHSAKYIHDTLDNGDKLNAGHYSCQYLILSDDDTYARTVGKKAKKSFGVAGVSVPDYVYDYLLTADNVYETYEEIKQDHAGTELTFLNGDTENINNTSNSDVIISTSSETKDFFEDKPEELLKVMGFDSDRFDRFAIIDGKELQDAWNISIDATVIKMSDSNRFGDFNDYTYKSCRFNDVKYDYLLSDFDKDSEEYEAMFGRRRGTPDPETKEVLLDIAERADLI